jgi:DNA-binding MarR family transcriptional regulator
MKIEANRQKRDETAALRSQLRNAKAQIRHLKNEILKGRTRLNPVEIKLLTEIAECHIDDAFAVTFAESLGLTKGQLDFHLTRLIKRGYIDVRFVDPELGDNFAITQKGRRAIFQKYLHH